MQRIISIFITLVLCCSCSGGSEFEAQSGPFTASFVDENEVTVGAFSYTVLNKVLQGTGQLTHNGDVITVTISASVEGKVINGMVNNSTFGTGPFWGNFSNLETASGGFNFTGNAGVFTTVGTWSAVVE